MPETSSLETKVDRLSTELGAVIQSLRLMSDMQRQQGEQLLQVIQLLTAPPNSELPELLQALVASNTSLITRVMDLASAVRGASEALPRQVAQALSAAVAEGSRR